MYFEEHCEESLRLFGTRFEEVHRFLDQYAGSEKYGMRHRRVYHHLAGIKEVEKLFGTEAARAARQHIISDLKMEGWNESYHFPRNEAEYVAMGFY